MRLLYDFNLDTVNDLLVVLADHVKNAAKAAMKWVNRPTMTSCQRLFEKRCLLCD